MSSVVITSAELASILADVKGSTVIRLSYLVDDSRSRQSCGKKQVQKQVYISHVYLNHDYTNKVRNLSGDENFVAQPLKGKTRVCGTLLQSDKTQELMIDGKVLNSQTSHLVALYHDGVEITEQEAVDNDWWMPSYYNPSETATSGRGFVPEDKDFYIINTYLSRIVEIKIKGTLYQIKKGD